VAPADALWISPLDLSGFGQFYTSMDGGFGAVKEVRPNDAAEAQSTKQTRSQGRREEASITHKFDNDDSL
jgi:hypothetical protein